MRRGRSRGARIAASAEEHADLFGGLAVVGAVTLLLELLRRAIGNRANTEITNLWITGRQLSQQIVGTHLLRDVVMQSRFLVEELEQHAEAKEETR